MHPSIAQRITVLEGLRARTRQATAEFYQKPNMIAPPLAPRYIVKPSGNNNRALHRQDHHRALRATIMPPTMPTS